MAYNVLVYSVQERLRHWVRRGSFLWEVLVGIKGFFRTLHQRLGAGRWGASEAKFRAIVDARAKTTKDFFFIQIGAHDGIMDDPIHEWIERFGWRGIFVEPQSAPFKRLESGYIENGTSQRFSFENVAIAHQDGTCEMYKVDDNAVTNALQTGLASLRPDRALSTYASMGTLAKETVQCITFDTLVRRNRVKRIDLLQIDTEGFDFEIIKMINFDRIKPRILQFEHRHLTEGEYAQCQRLLMGQGYAVFHMQHDTAAVLAEA